MPTQLKGKFLILKSVLAFFIIFFLICNFNHAIMVKLSLKKLTMEADAIVLGEVKKIQSQWSMDGSIILTIVTLQIHEILKGNVINNQVLIQYPGGEVGNIGLQVEDMPSFQMDEKVLIFLKSIRNVKDIKHSPIIALNIFQAFSVFGASQGKYSIDNQGIAQKGGYVLISKEKERDRFFHLSDLKTKIKNFLHNNSTQKGEDS